MALEASCISPYFFAKKPDIFGDDQPDYIKKSKAIIQETVKRFEDGMDSSRDLTSIFFETIAFLGEKRHEIAADHHYCAEYASMFGKRRDGDKIPGGVGMTFLNIQYEEYGQLMMKRLAAIVDKMKHDLKGFAEKTKKVEERCLGRLSTFEVEIVDAQDVPKAGWHPGVTFEEFCAAAGIPPEEVSKLDEDDTIVTKEFLRRIKLNHPVLYKRLKISAAFGQFIETFPSPTKRDLPDGSFTYDGVTGNLKSLFVLATKRLEIGGKLVSVAQYLTWMYCTFKEDPVERMVRCSKVASIHQDTFLIAMTLDDVAAIFANAMVWNRATESVQDLRDRVCLLRYGFSHAMPFSRGSAAIGEWLEAAIYKYHGFLNFRYVPEKCVELEAITSTCLSEFRKNYNESIILG